MPGAISDRAVAEKNGATVTPKVLSALRTSSKSFQSQVSANAMSRRGSSGLGSEMGRLTNSNIRILEKRSATL